MRLEIAIALLFVLFVIIFTGWLEHKNDKCRTCRHYNNKERLCEHPYCIHQFTVMDEYDNCGFYERKEEEK